MALNHRLRAPLNLNLLSTLARARGTKCRATVDGDRTAERIISPLSPIANAAADSVGTQASKRRDHRFLIKTGVFNRLCATFRRVDSLASAASLNCANSLPKKVTVVFGVYFSFSIHVTSHAIESPVEIREEFALHARRRWLFFFTSHLRVLINTESVDRSSRRYILSRTRVRRDGQMNTLNETTLNAVGHVAYPNKRSNECTRSGESTGYGLSSIAVPFDRFRGASRNGTATGW